MKKILFFISIWLFLCSCFQPAFYQKIILKYLINDKNTNGLFEKKDPIYLLANEFTVWEPGTEIDIGRKKVKVVNFKNAKQLEVIKFTFFKETDDTISIQMQLFNNNVIYKAIFKKDGKNLKKISSGIIFVRRPNLHS